MQVRARMTKSSDFMQIAFVLYKYLQLLRMLATKTIVRTSYSTSRVEPTTSLLELVQC